MRMALVETMPMSTSSDVLFPEPIQHVGYNPDEYCYGSTASTYSTYSHEVKYIFEPEYSQPRVEYSDISHFESVREEEEESQQPPMPRPEPIQDLYTPPRRSARNRLPTYPPNLPSKFDIHACRRRTWSPPTCSMGNASSFHAMRSYRSNDALDVDTDGGNLYEELDTVTTPPRIAPISGMLQKDGQQAIIRPVAFKPVVTPHMRYVSSPQRSPPQRPSPLQTTPPHQRPSPLLQRPLPQQRPSPIKSHDMRSANQSHDEGYMSQEYNSGSHSHSTSNTSNQSQNSYHLDSERSVSYGQVQNRLSDRTASYTSSNLSRQSSSHAEAYITTPSPSDSGVGELEAMLRDKDAEIQHLRETMEKNENAIMQVYQEKKQNWEMEIKEIHDEWERRLRLHQQRAFKMEQALLLQLFKLQQERKNLRLDVEQIRTEKERLEQKCEDFSKETQQSKAKLEELQWDMCQKTGEISHLKTQLKDAKEERTSKNNDLIGLKSQIRDLQMKNDNKEREVEHLQDELRCVTQEVNQMRLQVEQLHQQLSRTLVDKTLQTENAFKCAGSTSTLDTDADKYKQEMQKLQAEFHNLKLEYMKEKDKWLDEKNKVIRYQKHLQLNYVQMHRKNKMLENEVKQLMVEIENRDLHLTSEEERRLPQESQC